jgi:hypothetical protein
MMKGKRVPRRPRRKGTQKREKFRRRRYKLIVIERSSNLSINVMMRIKEILLGVPRHTQIHAWVDHGWEPKQKVTYQAADGKKRMKV